MKKLSQLIMCKAGVLLVFVGCGQAGDDLRTVDFGQLEGPLVQQGESQNALEGGGRVTRVARRLELLIG